MTAEQPMTPPRDHHDGQVHREFTGWAEAQGYRATGTEYNLDEMAEAFAAGWEAAGAVVMQPAPDPGCTVCAEVGGPHGVPQPAPGDRAVDIALASLAADRNQLREALSRIAFGVAGDPSVAADEALAASRDYREQWEGAVIAAQQPAPELQAGEIAYLYHWRFDRGEEFGLYRHAADAGAMAAKHAGEGLSEVLSMAVLGRPEQPAPELAAAEFRCPDCGSPQPSMHPAVSGGGEVTRICANPFHGDGSSSALNASGQ